MIEVSGRITGETVSWFHKNPSRSNQHCLYCGVLVGLGATVASDREHLIGRNFVPTGTIGGNEFNFLFRSCINCNRQKSDAERHISSVTLINSPARSSDDRVDTMAKRKAVADFHPDKKGIPVGNATEHMTLKYNHGLGSLKFELVSGPQVNGDLVKLLAYKQVQALFSLVTTENYAISTNLRLLPLRHFRYFGSFTFEDWGNCHLHEITQRVRNWPCPANIVAAHGYFKAILKSCREMGWFWALEWNKYLRVVGAIGRDEIFQKLPGLNWKPLQDGSGRYRRESPLTREDTLFMETAIPPF